MSRRRTQVTLERPRVEVTGADLTFWLPRELLSPNRLLGSHWRRLSQEKQAWRGLLLTALLDGLGARAALQRIAADSGVPGASGPRRRVRMRIDVRRLVPTRAAFLRDDDNLAFATKQLVDAIRELGLIFDDARAWTDRPLPEQELSADGQWWTVVRLAPADG